MGMCIYFIKIVIIGAVQHSISHKTIGVLFFEFHSVVKCNGVEFEKNKFRSICKCNGVEFEFFELHSFTFFLTEWSLNFSNSTPLHFYNGVEFEITPFHYI